MIFKRNILQRLLNQTTGEPDAGAPTPQPTPNPRYAAMQQLAQQRNERVAAEFQSFNEETGEVAREEPKPEPVQEAQPEQHEEKPAETVTAPVEAAKTRKIVVHGQTLEVPEDKIIESGIRTLQKETAADKLLQEAADKRRQAEELLRQAQQRLSNPDAAHQQAPSDQDAPQKSSLDPDSLMQQVTVVMERKLYNREAEKAVKVFETEFPEIAGDPVLRGYAARLEDERLAHVAAVGEPLGDPVDAYRKHGESVRKWLQERTGVKPTVPQDKQERKRTITTVQTANAAAPKPDAKKQPTREEIIEGMRVARQGRPVIRSQRI